MKQPNKSVLLKFENTARVADAGYHLQALCQDPYRPCFYIDSPADLMCSATWIERDDHNQGSIQAGPGGPLFEFLKKHKDDGSRPVLIVNFNHFSAADIVRFNALLDDKPNADGIPLPASATVVGLINPNERGAYTGLDFTSRFAKRHDFPERLTAQLDIPKLATPEERLPKAALLSQAINLYSNSNWEERLLGRWILKGQQLTFVEGELITAIKAGKTHIDIKNGPWGDQKFLRFWQAATLTRQFQCTGRTYDLPEGFVLTQTNSLQFKDVTEHLVIAEALSAAKPVYVLNPSTFSKFFNQYRCNNAEQAIYQDSGYLEANAEKTIAVYLSHALSEAAWSELLDSCTKQNVRLQLTLAPGVRLPAVLGLKLAVKPIPDPTPWPTESADPMPLASAIYIESSDADIAQAHLKADVIIDVSELEPANLLINIDGKLDIKTLRFKFNEKPGALLHALEQGQTVILKGQFSPQMQHYLSEELIKRQQKPSIGQLILVSDKPALFPNLPALKHTPTVAEKQALLETTFRKKFVAGLTESQINKQSLAELNAIIRYQSAHPESSDLKQTWLGMETLPKRVEPAAQKIDLKHAKAITDAFNQHRQKAVLQGLTIAPFVFLAGMTGVGKTTFIKEIWKLAHPNMHFGESELGAWAKDRRPGIKTLFIDEANLSARQWRVFEGLFNKPPGIMVDNEYVPLTPEHKVIFAGNPVSYGGGRHLPDLFKRHGGSIIFEPMPPEYIYHEMLAPVFNGTGFSTNEHEAASLKILNIAAYLTQLSHDDVLISTRELTMVALLAVNYCKDNPKTTLVDATAYYAYTIGLSLVPEASRAQFDKAYFAPPLPPSASQVLPNDFTITASNQKAFEALTHVLNLRETRRHQKGNKTQQSGGLGGLILEGDPGIGKSELVIAALTARHYQEGHDFYIIPPSMALEAKKELLLKAYSQGAIVIINEINSSSMMERFLNDLLMGEPPPGVELGKIRPGFTVIGPQNPSAMAGRARASKALQHRMQTIIMPSYKPHEMAHILSQKGLPENIAEDMTTEYHLIIKEALRNNRPPPLCFRDLIKRAEWEMSANRSVSASVNPSLAEMDWDTLINNPWSHPDNALVTNKAHALLTIYKEAPPLYQKVIATKLHELATDKKHAQPEAWLALAIVAFLEMEDDGIINCLNTLRTTQATGAPLEFFAARARREHDKVCKALLSGTELKRDVRGINAFITAYAEYIQTMLKIEKLRPDVV
ncbi:MAG: hypothetical protein A3F46_09360 [Legionellales bacterium RIFCSPHIGHO2_12_FULL_42_9]|nr:MAG: hypothetical protein A3F46_09360 [Legionellales bacterium RIFCSPHIGHO2_12_FULL_42_9]